MATSAVKRPTSFRCRTCGESFGSLGAVRAHHTSSHPPTPAAAGPATIPPARPSFARGSLRRIEDAIASGPTASPIDDHPDQPAPPDHPSIAPTTIRVSPEQRAASVRDAVRDGLPVNVLADVVRGLSVSLSEIDGAGERGYLSPIQSTQVAVLLHDATIELVVSRFNGDVSRFKAALAVVIILGSKGRVHAAAIADRLGEIRTSRAARPVAPSPAGEPAEPDDVTRAALARQAALMASGTLS